MNLMKARQWVSSYVLAPVHALDVDSAAGAVTACGAGEIFTTKTDLQCIIAVHCSAWECFALVCTSMKGNWRMTELLEGVEIRFCLLQLQIR